MMWRRLRAATAAGIMYMEYWVLAAVAAKEKQRQRESICGRQRLRSSGGGGIEIDS
jgi:hypothetical protein